MQSVPITTKGVSSNPVHGGAYSIQPLCFSVTCDRSVVSPSTPVSSIIKTDRHDITEILLKVALKYHTPPPPV